MNRDQGSPHQDHIQPLPEKLDVTPDIQNSDGNSDSGGGPNGPGDGGDSQGGGPSGSGGGGGGGGFRGRKVTTCSFCGKTSREVGPMVEGPGDVYICSNCTDLCQNIFRQERRRVDRGQPLFNSIPTPRQIKEFLDQYVIGQDRAKRALPAAGPSCSSSVRSCRRGVHSMS